MLVAGPYFFMFRKRAGRARSTSPNRGGLIVLYVADTFRVADGSEPTDSAKQPRGGWWSLQ